LEGVSVRIFHPVSTPFSLSFSSQKGCECFQIHASPLEGVSVRIFQPVSTPFSLSFSSQQGLRALPNPRVSFGRCFGDDFPGSTDSIFVDFF
jgi:hypothetical protein